MDKLTNTLLLKHAEALDWGHITVFNFNLSSEIAEKVEVSLVITVARTSQWI